MLLSRRTPHPNAFSRSIAATSSGLCIASLRGNSPRVPLVRPSLRPIAIGPAQTPQGQALTPAFNLPARVGQRLGVSL